MTSRSEYQYKQKSRNVLLLTDGSDRARRKAEWVGVFADSSRTTIHRIDVLDCLDSGMIIHKRTIVPRDDPEPRATSEINVLHGVPDEALLDYIAANGIDQVIICMRKMSNLNRSFIGQTFATITRSAAVPVILIGNRDERPH